MRYRDGQPAGMPDYGGTEDMLLFTVVLGLVIGVALTWLGVRGRQIWLATWNAGLVVACLAYLGWHVAR